MSVIRAAIARRPIASYLAIAFASTWAVGPLGSVSVAFALSGLFGPALAAVVVSWAEGSGSVLRSRITDWRHPVRWYAVAFGLPFAVAAVVVAIHVLIGGRTPGLGTISALESAIFVLVIGEEIGWRGFLQPRLRRRMALVPAGVATGVAWTGWHLPMFLTPVGGVAPLAAFAWWVVPLAVVMGAVAERTRWSVIVATIMHGAANVATPLLLPGVDRGWVLIATGAIYLVLVAAIVFRTSRSSDQVATTTRPYG